MAKEQRSNKWTFLFYKESAPDNYLETLEEIHVPFVLSPWHDKDVNKETGEFKTVYANEFDSYASETFEMNYPTVKVDQRDIHLVPVEDVPKTDF